MNGPSREEAPSAGDVERLNPDGNERLTAAAGIVLVVLILVELATLLFGLHRFLSVHVFVGLVLIPLVLLKLASTGWRFTRYYTRSAPYRGKGAPVLVMRLLAPFLVAATLAVFGSGVAMGVFHGRSLHIARQVHGPASVIWLVLLGVHVLAYLQRAFLSAREEVDPDSRRTVPGTRWRIYVLVGAIVVGLATAITALPADHNWLHLPPKHDHRDGTALPTIISARR